MQAIVSIALLWLIAQVLQHYLPERKGVFLMVYVVVPLLIQRLATWGSLVAWR